MTAQLGRPPRGRWRVAARCAAGAPLVVAVAPVLEDGSLFPTTFWLTCPRLVEAVAELESAGECAKTARRVARNPELVAAVAGADAAYREARRAEGGGVDPCAGVGIAGQRDPLAVKCLHARLASALAGIADPIGAELAAHLAGAVDARCAEPRCQAPAARGC